RAPGPHRWYQVSNLEPSGANAETFPDSNFSLQQVCHKFVMTRVQACSKLTKASKSPWNELAASLPCKLIANYSKKQSTNTTRERTRDLPLSSQTSIPLRQLDYERRR
ncbi:hypothetical protein AVEN_70538-1, partial [Araneus ventricosus]